MAINLNDCNQLCFGCIKKYKKKHDIKTGESFEVDCKGIPAEYVPSEILSTFSESDKDSATALFDPVTWAAKTLDWHCIDPDGSVWKRKNPEEYYEWIEKHPGEPILNKSRYHRPYQAELLRCTSPQIVSRIGRQAGKTESLIIKILYNLFTKPGRGQDEGFKIILITPFQAQIDLIFERLNTLIKSSTLTQNSIKRSVKAPVYTLELHNSSLVRGFSCIAGTRIVTKNGIVPIEQITTKDLVLSKNTNNILEFLPVSYVFAPNYKDVFKVILNDGHTVTVSNDHPFWTKNGWKKLKELKAGDQVASVNDYHFDNSINEVDDLSYLFGLILGDGNITNCTLADGGPRFTSKNPLIQKSFEDVLARLNIDYRFQFHSKTESKEYTVRKRTFVKNTRPQDRPLTSLSNLIYKYRLNGCSSFNKFIPLELLNGNASVRLGLLKGLLETDGFLLSSGEIGFCSVSKELAYQVGELLNTFGIRSTIRLKKQKGKKIPINTEQRIVSCNYDLYELNIRSKIYVKKLLNLIDLSNKKNTFAKCFNSVADINQTIESDISFSKIRSIEFLGKDTTYDISVGDGTNNFIANGILLHNTAGTKSGGNADSVRGQTGHMLIFDEADYLAAGDIDSSLAIITNNPGSTVWMSSTPTGRRERFYQTCLSRQWKEFHYPSHANPMFGEQMDKIFKEQLTAIGYRHEILAEFGEQEEGVFQNSYVQAARYPFEYRQYQYNRSWLYTVGVDWNDTKNGTTIAVLGLDPSRNKFVLVDKYIVSREGWTQLTACQKIAEVNRLWKPMSIYVDAGFGSTQYEVLRKFGFDALGDPTKGPMHPDAKIPYVLKQYDFGSRIDTRDIFTGLPMKKEAKPFLVESAMRRFEAQDIEIPESDEDLEKQLLSYVIDRITPTGRPVYKASDESIGDHFLDAVMLSIVAFVLESTPIGKPRMDSSIAFTGYFGEGKSNILEDGGLVIRPDVKQKTTEEKNRHRPDSRSIGEEKTSLLKSQKELPANHVSRDTKPGIWNWNGFLRDEPKPKTRTLSEAEADARKRQGLSPLRGSKPRRKNI